MNSTFLAAVSDLTVCARSEIPTAVNFQVEIAWVLTPYSVAARYQPCYFHLHLRLEFYSLNYSNVFVVLIQRQCY